MLCHFTPLAEIANTAALCVSVLAHTLLSILCPTPPAQARARFFLGAVALDIGAHWVRIHPPTHPFLLKPISEAICPACTRAFSRSRGSTSACI